MTRYLPLASLIALAIAAPAAAQQQGPEGDSTERVMMVNLRPGEACPVSTDPGTIVVCDEIEDPYRIPRQLRQGQSPENRSWGQRVEDLQRVGAAGPLSCTNTGGGAELGCTAQFIEDAAEERATAPGVRYSEQIAAVRAERLATIDRDAALTQSRVEAIEAEYIARENAQSEAPLPDEGAPPQVVDPAAIPARP